MAEFLSVSALLVLSTVVTGLVRVLRGPADTDRIMAAQLLGTGGIAALLLAGVAMDVTSLFDLALIMALLAAFASVAMARAAPAVDREPEP